MKSLLEQIQELVPLAEAATEGPWLADLRSGIAAIRTEVHNGLCGDEEDVIVASRKGSTYIEGTSSHWEMDEQVQRDLVFMAAARNLDWQALAAALAPTTGEAAGPEWVSVEERLPKYKGYVAAALADGRVIGCYCDPGFDYDEDGDTGTVPPSWDAGFFTTVTHWMPLPAAPIATPIAQPTHA